MKKRKKVVLVSKRDILVSPFKRKNFEGTGMSIPSPKPEPNIGILLKWNVAFQE